MGRLAALLLVLGSTAWAGPFDLPEEGEAALPFKLSGLIDARYAYTSPGRGWLQGGANKLRYGGRDVDNNGSGDRNSHVLAVPQASLVLEFPVLRHAKVHVQMNLEVDTDADDSGAGVIVARADVERRLGPFGTRLRLGAFIPPISWEHPDAAWSTRYTLTPSAIGSWVGEEVRALGAEGVAEYKAGGRSVRVTGGVFSGGDQTGWVLLDRGWALHDYQLDLTGSLPLPNGSVERRVFRELDGRPGIYGRLDLGLGGDLLALGGGWWDNRADPDGYFLDGTTPIASWATHFGDVGARLNWRRLTLLGQYLEGSTSMPAYRRRGFSAWYALASVELGRFAVAGRFDRFKVFGWEEGRALTGAVHWNATLRQRLSAEYVHVFSKPGLAVRPRGQKDALAQVNYRFRFGG